MNDFESDMDPGTPLAEGRASDSHGRAALLLVESLIHALIARSSLTVAEAIEVVDIAAAVEMETFDVALGSIQRTTPSLLTPIAASLRFDLPDGA